MSRGLGLVRDLIIDQHFAQRARIERLLGAVGENPGVLGIGIDEDTGVILEPDDCFDVIGSGAVYVVDGRALTHTNVSEQASRSTLCLFDVTLHVLDKHSGFDLKTRRPFRKEDGA
jgi:cyanophycinase